MQGLMMQQELMISDLIEHAAKVHSNREIYTLNADMSEHRYTWADCAVRTRKLANALLAAGVKTGDRVATIAWNNYRHIEVYYACLLYTSPSPRDQRGSRMPSSA